MVEIITIPEKLIKERELVLVPRSEYEKLLRISKKQAELDQGIDKAIEETRQGKTIGPFDNSRNLMKSLSPRALK